MNQQQHRHMEFNKGGNIFREGQEGNCAYLIKSGVVSVYKIINSKKVMLTKMKAGQILGEMAVINNERRSASAEAAEHCVLVRITSDVLSKALEQSIPFVKGITEQLIRRFKEKDKEISDHLSNNIFMSVAYLINLLLTQERKDIEYKQFSVTVTNILAISQNKIDTIIKKLDSLQLLKIKNIGKSKYICIDNKEYFLEGAIAFKDEMQAKLQEQESLYIDINGFAEFVDSTPQTVSQFIKKEKIPQNMFYFSKALVAEWLEKVGKDYFNKGYKNSVEAV